MMWVIAVVVALIVLSRSGILSRLKNQASPNPALSLDPPSVADAGKLTDLVRDHQQRRRQVEAEEKMLREFFDHGKESPE